MVQIWNWVGSENLCRVIWSPTRIVATPPDTPSPFMSRSFSEIEVADIWETISFQSR
jgi:hypothetical protein